MARFGGTPVKPVPSGKPRFGGTAVATPPAGLTPGSREYADWAAKQARDGKALPKVSETPPATLAEAPAAPAKSTDNYLQQGLSGLNEGIASALGAPVDLATMALNLGAKGVNAVAHTEIPEIKDPVGGGTMFRELMSPTMVPESEDKGQQVVRRIAQEVGAVAVPGMGTIGKASKPLKVAAEELGLALGSGTGAAVAEQIAPGNPGAEIAGQVLGSLTPAGILRQVRKIGVGKAAKIGPTLDELRDLKTATYKMADNAGVQYAPASVDGLLAKMVQATQDEHISPDRHKAAFSMLQDLVAKKGTPLTLTQLDQLRQVIRRDLITPSYGNPAMSSDAHFGGIMLDEIDDFIATAGMKDVVTGDPKMANTLILASRELNTRLRKTEIIDDALYKAKLQASASGSGGNLNNAIRQQIKSILTNPKRVRAFTKSERSAMENLVRQSRTENLLRWVGKFSPGGNGLIGALEVVGTLHNPATAALPVAGLVAKGIADRGTLTKAGNLRDTVARGSAVIAPPNTLAAPNPTWAPLIQGQIANDIQPAPVRITVHGGN